MKFPIFQSWEDASFHERMNLVFENRFRGYGAYALRQQYVRNKLIGMLLSALFVAGLAALFLIPGKTISPLVIRTIPPYDIPVFPQPDEDESQTEPKSGGGKPSSGSSNLTPDIDPSRPSVPGPFSVNPNFGIGPGTEEFPGPGSASEDLPGGPKPGGAASQSPKIEGCIFKGGNDAFTKYIQSNFNPPVSCDAEDSYGMVRVRFMVGSNGLVSRVTILSSTIDCEEFKQEAIRVLMESPKWRPASVNGVTQPAWREMDIRLVVGP